MDLAGGAIGGLLIMLGLVAYVLVKGWPRR
jgi:hypothetical protein